MKIHDVYLYSSINNLPLLGEKIVDFPFMKTYLENYIVLDKSIDFEQGDRRLLPKVATIGDDYTISIETAYGGISDFITSFLIQNYYKYDTLYKTELFEYNPIYNVEEHTTRTNIRTPDLTEVNDYGQRSTTTGSQSNTISSQSTESTNTRKKAPFDSETFSNQEQFTESAITQPITNIIGSHTDTIAGVTDTKKNSGTDKNEETIDRTGNIGVMSSQNLITQERQVAEFSFVNRVITDIINYLCYSLVD